MAWLGRWSLRVSVAFGWMEPGELTLARDSADTKANVAAEDDLGRYVSYLAFTILVLVVPTFESNPRVRMEAIAAADAAQQVAVAAEADQYAPEAMNAAARARAALDAEIAAQGELMSITRSYKRAEDLVAAYMAAAEQATRAAAAGKEQARNEATALITEGRTALYEATSELARAPRGRGSAVDLAAMKADLEAAGVSLTEAEASLAAGTFLDAKSKARRAKETIQRVKDAIARPERSLH